MKNDNRPKLFLVKETKMKKVSIKKTSNLILQRAGHKFYLLQKNAKEENNYKNQIVTKDEVIDLFKHEHENPLAFIHFIPDEGDWITIAPQFKEVNLNLLDEIFEKFGF